MSAPVKILPCITDLSGQQERHPGGHNWPDMEIVVDPAQTEIENDELYLVSVPRRGGSPYVKRCRNKSDAVVWLHPAVATIHDAGKHATLFGKKMPIQTIEFSDNIYRWALTVHGKVIGVWAGAA